VVAVGLTDKLLPVPTKVPPQVPEYQVITSPVPPPPPFNVRVVLCPLQMVVDAAVAEVGSRDVGLTISIDGFEFAIGQPVPVPSSSTNWYEPASAIEIEGIVRVKVPIPSKVQFE